jgi:rhamnose transport system substrate-binding protein
MTRLKKTLLGIGAGLAAAALSMAHVPSDAHAAEAKVAFVPQIQGIPYYVSMENGAKAAAEKFGVTYVQQGPTTTSAADQLRIFESFVNQGFDVIGVSPNDIETLKPAIAKATAQGVKVITSDADAPGTERLLFVAQALDQDLGYTVMDELVKRIGEEGKVAIVSDSPTIQSLNNWIAAIKERAATKYPKIEIVSVDHTDGTAAKAYQYATDAMTKHPDLKAIVGIASTTCPGVAQAVEAADKIGQVITTGYCAPNTARQYVKSGAMPFTVLWSPYDLGYLTVWAAKQLIDGKSLQDTNEVPGLSSPATYMADQKLLLLGPPFVFTSENVDKFDF